MNIAQTINRVLALQVDVLELSRQSQQAREDLRKHGTALFESVRHLVQPGQSEVKFICGGRRYEVKANGELVSLDESLPVVDSDTEVSK